MSIKKRYFTVTLILLFSILLSSCSFVSYIKYADTTAPEASFEETLDLYLSKLDMLTAANIHDASIHTDYKIALLDAKNELNECSAVSELHTVFSKHFPKLATLVLSSNLAFENYREEEQKLLEDMVERYTSAMADVSSVDGILELFSQFKNERDAVITYEAYVATLKKTLSSDLKKLPVYTDYADNEQEELNTLINQFLEALKPLQIEEDVLALFDTFKNKILNVPTVEASIAINKNKAIEEWTERLNQFNSTHSASLNSQITNLLTEMNSLSSAQAVHKKGAIFLMDAAERIGNTALADMRSNAKIYLNNLVLAVDYRETQVSELQSILSNVFTALNVCATHSDVRDQLRGAEEQILALPTNDLLWEQENIAFFDSYNSIYGNNGLEIPSRMDEVCSYEEMASIIDFYAFHQTSYDAFLRDTFRVKLLYPHRNAQWEVNEVYWYCELIRGVVGITASLERTSSGDYLTITLIPYALSTQTTANPSPVEVERLESLVEYRSNTSDYTPRADDFEDFAYLTQYTKTINGIWNSHQLWYALEHGYIPEVVSGSAAEATLERAKELLRELVLDGMSDEEKIYAIFTWFGRNVIFDDDYIKYIYPTDRDHFPDELASTYKAFHAEGALFDNLAVCEGFAKAMLIMLRLEGIECYRVFLHSYTENAINNLGMDGYGSHALVSIKMPDGLYYISDPYESYQHNTPYPKLHQFLIPWDFHTTYIGAWTQIYTDLVYGKTLLPSVMENLVYNGISIFTYTEQELETMLDGFRSAESTNVCVSIFNYNVLDKDFDVFEKIKASGMNYYKISYNGLDEYILYK